MIDASLTVAGIQGPGGYGKTTLLRSLPTEWEVVDDAHLLPPSRLDELRALVLSGERLAIAYRPWPRPPGLTDLIEVIRRQGRIVVLSPLSEDEVGSVVYAQTLGVPRFVERMLGAASLEAAVYQFAPDLDALEPEARQALLILAVDGLDLLGDLLGADAGRAEAAAKASGLLHQDNTLAPLARQAIIALSPAGVRDDVWQRIAALRLKRGSPLLPMIRVLRRARVPLADVYSAAAEEALTEDPTLSAELFALGNPMSARHAYAAALSGDLGTALRLTDRLLATDPTPDAATIAATALAHRGQLTRSAALYAWAGTPFSTAFAAITSTATGTLPGGPSPEDALPTMVTAAVSLMAQGVRESLTGTGSGALSPLVQACSLLEPSGRGVLLPDSPAGLAALAGLHCGEFGSAESVLDSALAAGVGGPLLGSRHRLLKAWIPMVRAGAPASSVVPEAHMPLVSEPRDALFAAALELGIARRASDLVAMQQGWPRACEALLRHPVDLFTLLPLGELAIAAARLGELSRLGGHLRDADALLQRLGNPVLWATPWHWSCLHAALAAEELAAAEDRLTALVSLPHTRYGGALAAAAECWLEMARGQVDPEKAETAARGLHAVGLSWDGARLAGQAAIRTSDRRAMTTLLDTARMLQGKPTGRRGSQVQLSEREQEVADLVLAGHTYKQVADKLFISAKTVEHHMARIRQRLNCNSRSELLARLRAMANPIPRPRQPAD